jgi:DNA repair protein RecO (recombination protein O)
MQWADQGIILSVRRHGETSAIAEVLTEAHGRALGLVRGGRSRQQRPTLQSGNLVTLTWRARLEDHLGTFVIEPLKLQAGAIMESAFRLAGVTTLAVMAQALPEREPHRRMYDAARVVLEAIEDDATWPALLVRWEMGLLDELGFGLDTSKCAATGVTDDLCYISPRTGRAVSRQAGDAYKEKLLPLPPFLIGKGSPTPEDVRQGFALTAYFLERHVFEARGLQMPMERQRVIEGLGR